jgi:cytochrome c oxidase cbb3-type subunit 1
VFSILPSGALDSCAMQGRHPACRLARLPAAPLPIFIFQPGMTAVAPSARATAKPLAEVSMAEIEASGRLPIIWLVAGGGLWLCVALLLLLVDSLKLHLPSFLAGGAFWTYGRVREACVSSLYYGCAVQWTMAGSLWLLCHVGRARVAAPAMIGIGVVLWDCAAAIGVFAILCGQSTGMESLAMPGYLAPILLSAYLLMGICAALTFHDRREGLLYPSQWFVVGALFWFAWIFSTASLVLAGPPVRGVLQASIEWWYGHNFSNVFVGFAGLGLIFYFVPKLSGRPLSSYYLASLAFWVIALFGGWGGIPAGAPLPSWIASVGVAGTVFTSAAVLAVAINVYLTTRGAPCAPCHDAAGRFIFAGLIFWLLASAQEIAGVLPAVSAVTDFTWYREAQHELFYYGFFSMTLFGAIYYFMPRVLGWQSGAERGLGNAAARAAAPGGPEEVGGAWKPGLMRAHFWLALFGVLIGWLSLLVGGLWQGLLLQEPANTFVSTMRQTLPAIRGSTLGILLLLAGVMVFLLNLALLLSRFCYRCREGSAARGRTGKERP